MDARDVLADAVLRVQEGLCELVAELCGICARGGEGAGKEETDIMGTGTVAREKLGNSHPRHSLIFGDSHPSKHWPQVHVPFFSSDMAFKAQSVQWRAEGRGAEDYGI